MEYLKHAPRTDLHCSVSQIRCAQLCSKKYEYRYVLGAEAEHRSPNLVLGSAVHEALARYYTVIRNGAVPHPEGVLAAYSDAFDAEAAKEPAVLLDDGETLGALKDSGVALVKAFLGEVKPPDKVFGVETAFACDVIDPDSGEILEEQLVGAFDAVVEDAGKLVVLEHKTAARAWSADQLEYDLQVGIYQAVTGADLVRLQVLTKTKVAKFYVHDLVRTDAAQVEAVSVVCRVLKAIRAGAFWHNRGWQCKDCEYRSRCGAVPEARTAAGDAPA